MLTLQVPQAGTPAPTQITVPGATGLPQNISRPMSLQDVQLLQNRRNELSRQLSSATDRRSQVVREMGRSANGREGLDARLKVLDERIVQLEKDIAQNGQLLASAPADLVEETAPAPVFPATSRGLNANSVAIALIVVIGFPLVVTWCLRALRRPVHAPPAFPTDTIERISRIETSVDSIALEVERISEGQRFVTKLMNQSHQLGAGAAEPIAIKQGERVPLGHADAP